MAMDGTRDDAPRASPEAPLADFIGRGATQVRTLSQTIMSRQTSLLSRHWMPPYRDQGLEWIEDPRFAFPFLLRKGG